MSIGKDLSNLPRVCRACRDGDHEHCVDRGLNDGAVDALDFVMPYCFCPDDDCPPEWSE